MPWLCVAIYVIFSIYNAESNIYNRSCEECVYICSHQNIIGGKKMLKMRKVNLQSKKGKVLSLVGVFTLIGTSSCYAAQPDFITKTATR